MIPKEKALRICQEIGRSTLFADDCNDGNTLPLRVSKIIALIMIKEILKDINIEHLNQLKVEIEKL